MKNVFLILIMFFTINSFAQNNERISNSDNFALKLINQNKYREAETILKDLQDENSKMHLALLYLNKDFKNEKEAIHILKEISQNNTDIGISAKGILQYIKENFKKAKMDLEKSDSISYSNYYLGLIALEEKDDYLALSYLKKAYVLGDYRAVTELSSYYLKAREEQTLLLSDLILKECYTWLLLGIRLNIKNSEINFNKIEPMVLPKLKKEAIETVIQLEKYE